MRRTQDVAPISDVSYVNKIGKLMRYWLPKHVQQDVVAPALAAFYSQRTDYHAMTASEDKIEDPQVRLLIQCIKPKDILVEFGCGGGVVLSRVGCLAKEATGIDIADLALHRARSRRGQHRVVKADVTKVPLADNYADITYSFEVLEHVWDPVAVIREMVRVTKPGGTVFFTTPNGYTMNPHLNLRRAVRAINLVGALAAELRLVFSHVLYENIPPDLDAMLVYPDCDMITRVRPRKLPELMKSLGCEVNQLETFFFLAAKADSDLQRRRYDHLQRHWFFRWYGDHILLIATKRG